MNIIIANAVVVAICFSFAYIGYLIGYRRGFEKGRDSEWMDAFFRKIDADKTKRDTLGRYKKTSSK